MPTVNSTEARHQHGLQPPAVAQTAGDDHRDRQGREIGDDHGLHLVKWRREGLRQGWQRDIGDARSQRGQQHCQGKGQRRGRFRVGGFPSLQAVPSFSSSCLNVDLHAGCHFKST